MDLSHVMGPYHTTSVDKTSGAPPVCQFLDPPLKTYNLHILQDLFIEDIPDSHPLFYV